jgi:hypothetical protein
MDPIYKLFDYACDRFYTIEYGNDYQPRIIKGLLLNCGGPHYYLLTEHGLCVIKTKGINTMFPIPMPKDLSDNFRKVVETYLKEQAEFKRGQLNDEEN